METTKKINGEKSASQAVAQSNANKNLLDSILQKFNSQSDGLLKTSMGKSQEIYNPELFTGMVTDSQIKAVRRKLRNYTFSALSTICETKSEKLISAFIEFYKSTYIRHDFSFSSIASENTKDIKKNILKKGLDICAQYAQKQAK